MKIRIIVHIALCMSLISVFGLCFAEQKTAPADVVPVWVSTTIAPDTPFSTVAYTYNSGKEGPSIVLIGGLNGDEPVTRAVAQQISQWRVEKGKLTVIPRANEAGCISGVRTVAGVDGKSAFSLATAFSGIESAKEPHPIVAAIWHTICDAKPNWVIEFRSSRDYLQNSTDLRPSFGNTVSYWPGGDEEKLLPQLIAQTNADMPSGIERHGFVQLNDALNGSPAGAARKVLKCKALRVTSAPEHAGAAQRRCAMLANLLLVELGMVPCPVDTFFFEQKKANEHRVAIYDDTGAGAGSAFPVERCYEGVTGAQIRRIAAATVYYGGLAQFDVVVFPGGSGSSIATALTKEGRERVVEFVKNGGGYIGICAGAYLGTAYYSWSLGIIRADVKDSAHWARGSGTVEIELSKAGASLIGRAAGLVNVYYGQGPLLVPRKEGDLPKYEVLGIYRGEFAENGAPAGVMPGTDAMIRAPFGKGRVVLCSPHPESSKDTSLRALIPAWSKWCAGGK